MHARAPGFQVRQATAADRDDVARMRVALWPGLAPAASVEEVVAIVGGRNLGGMPWTLFVARDRSGRALGFAEVSLHNHAGGCDPDHPVGYLEGWWVEPDARLRGVGAALVDAAMAWAASQGCVEFASDALVDNEGSRRAHAALGFEEGSAVVTFRRRIDGRR